MKNELERSLTELILGCLFAAEISGEFRSRGFVAEYGSVIANIRLYR